MIRTEPSNRRTFGAHAIDGWYIGPSLNHYKCYCCHVPDTGAIIHTGIVEFFPYLIPFPTVDTNTYLQ